MNQRLKGAKNRAAGWTNRLQEEVSKRRADGRLGHWTGKRLIESLRLIDTWMEEKTIGMALPKKVLRDQFNKILDNIAHVRSRRTGRETDELLVEKEEEWNEHLARLIYAPITIGGMNADRRREWWANLPYHETRVLEVNLKDQDLYLWNEFSNIWTASHELSPLSKFGSPDLETPPPLPNPIWEYRLIRREPLPQTLLPSEWFNLRGSPTTRGGRLNFEPGVPKIGMKMAREALERGIVSELNAIRMARTMAIVEVVVGSKRTHELLKMLHPRISEAFEDLRTQREIGSIGLERLATIRFVDIVRDGLNGRHLRRVSGELQRIWPDDILQPSFGRSRLDEEALEQSERLRFSSEDCIMMEPIRHWNRLDRIDQKVKSREARRDPGERKPQTLRQIHEKRKDDADGAAPSIRQTMNESGELDADSSEFYEYMLSRSDHAD